MEKNINSGLERNSESSKNNSSLFIKNKLAIFISFIILFFLVVISLLIYTNSSANKEPKSFEDCIRQKGATVQYSFPPTCISSSGKLFTKNLTPEELQNSTPTKVVEQKPKTSKEIESFCTQNGGKFLYELNERNKYMECENISELACQQAGGIFEECASACRHTGGDMCIQVCVPVCRF